MKPYALEGQSMDWTAVIEKIAQKRRPIEFSAALIRLFEKEGLYPLCEGAGQGSVLLYLRIGRWLVQARHLAWFLRYVEPDMRELGSLRYVYLQGSWEGPGAAPHLIRYKEELGKVAFFDASRERKRAFWSEEDTFERALRGRTHFVKSNFIVPRQLSYDRDHHMIEEALVDTTLMRSTPSALPVLREVSRFQALNFHACHATADYIKALSLPSEWELSWLEEGSVIALRQCFERLVTAPAGLSPERVFVTWSHNDLSPSNMLGTDHDPICIDFEQSGDGSIWFDPTYMYFTWEGLTLEDLWEALAESHRLAGSSFYGRHMLAWHIDLFCLELFHQSRFLLHQSDELPMARIHLLNRALRLKVM